MEAETAAQERRGKELMLDAEAATQAEIAAECSALSRYLVGIDADERLLREYGLFRTLRAEERRVGGLFDRLSLALLRRGRAGAAFVDAYVARMQRDGPAFERLVGMLALLECLPNSARLLDAPDPGGPTWIIAKLALRGLLDLGLFALSALVLGPVHALQAMTSRSSG